MLKRSICASTFLFSLSLIFTIHGMDPNARRYELDVLKQDNDSFKIRISATDQLGGKKSGSFIANFATHHCDNQKDLFAPFDIPMRFGNAADADSFLWDVPDFGFLKLHQDGSTFFGHSRHEVPLAADALTFNTSGELFLQTLRVAALHLKSRKTQFYDAVIADEIDADHQVVNSGALQTHQLTGKGQFYNEGRLEFKGGQNDTAQLGVRFFQNRSNSHCTPTVSASHLCVTGNNQKIINKKDAQFEVSGKLSIDAAHEVPDALFENEGVLKTHTCNAKRSMSNGGFLQAEDVTSEKLENKEFGQVKILKQIFVEDLKNDGDLDVNRYIEMNFCTNRGAIHGSPDLALRIRSVMRNYGQIRLLHLLGTADNEYKGNAVLNNYKELLFHDNGSLDGGYLINEGLVKGLGMRLSKALIDNKKGACFELVKSSIDETRKITNDGDFLFEGGADVACAPIHNKGNMTFRSGSLSCKNSALSNEGNWLFEGVTSDDSLSMISYKGVLECVKSSLHFGHLVNHQDLVLRSGLYNVYALTNKKKLQLCGNDWAITDDAALPAPNKLVITKSPVQEADLGEIEAEHNLLYDLPVMPQDLRAEEIDCSQKHTRNIEQLQKLTTSNKVTVQCDPASITNGDITFPNIGHLELHVNGPLIKLGSLTAPALSLYVNGAFTGGKSNTELATIAATHGPLKVNADSIDGSFAKFYGKGKTDLESTKADIKIGAPVRGVDEEVKQQFSNALMQRWGRGNGAGVAATYLANFDYRLDLPNGASVTSNDYITLRSVARILLDCGTLRSQVDPLVPTNTGIHLIAPAEINNQASKISSDGSITVETHVYNHLRKSLISRTDFPQAWFRSPSTQYPGSVAAVIESLAKIYFIISSKICNRASVIRSSQDIILNGLKNLVPAAGYFEEIIPYHSGGYWAPPHACNYPLVMPQLFTHGATMQAGENIKMNLGNFVVVGNWNAPGVLVLARTGLFSNGGKLTRESKQINGPIVVDVTRFMRQEAEQPGFYRLAQNGAIETEFPFGVPSAPQAGDLVALENPHYQTPLHWKTIFNPLSSINLDMHLQRLLGDLAGKVYADQAKGDQLATVLRGNANRWREEHGKEVMSQADLQQIKRSMLLAQIAYNNDTLTEEQKTLLCIASDDINPYQDAGDIVTDHFVCETDGDQKHQNNRIIAQDKQGIEIRSRTGDVTLETEKYTTEYHNRDIDVVEDHAYPQQQLIAPQGPVTVLAHHNVERTGTAIMAGAHAHVHAQTGALIKNPLTLQKFVKTRTEDAGLFSSKTTITTDLSHQILPSTTIATNTIHDQAGSSIHAVATQDVAGQSIMYESPDTVVEGIILADRTERSSHSSSAFSKQSHSEMRETACAMPASIRAPQVRFIGDTARVNANITATELHDDTRDGIQFVAKVKEMLYSQQTLVDSPLMSMDAGCRGGYETMIPPMLMVDRIIRVSPIGQMLFESAVIDKDRTEIIGRFVETTYQLKKWHEEWCHKDQAVSDEMLVAIAIAITVATDGMGAELLAITAEHAAIAAMVNAGFSTLCATAGTSLLRTGDPLQVMEQMASPQFLKSLAIDVASAGLCQKLGGALNINMASSAKPLIGHVQEQALRSTVNTLLNVAVNDAPVGKSVGNAVAQISLKAIAGYVSNGICSSHLDNIEQKVTHTVLGGAIGFAESGNSKGLASGAVGALTAQTVGALLTEDAFAVSDAAIGRLKKDGKPLTQENIQKAVEQEVAYRIKIAKVASATVAAVAGLNPSIASQTASNVLDNDVAMRAQIYALSEMQSLLTAASRAVVNLTVQPVSVSNSVRLTPEQPAQEFKSAGKKKERGINKSAKFSSKASAERDAAHNLMLSTIGQRPYSYDDLIMECAQEWDVRDDIQEKKERRPLFDRIVNPKVHPVIKETSEIIEAAWKDAINRTIDTYAMVPNPVGLACFAAETGRDLYQERTTVGEVAFNAAAAYGALKGLQWTGRGIKKIYNYAQSKLSRSTPEVYNSIVGSANAAVLGTDTILSKLHQERYAVKERIPLVENPIAGKWSDGRMSGDIVLGSDPFNIAYQHSTRFAFTIDSRAPFNVVGHGNSAIMALEIQNIHPKALSQANLRILKEEGEVLLNAVQLARLIRTAPGYNKGQHIHLFSCETGARADGLAQRLATRMGVEVSAFTENVHVFNDKPLFVAYCKATEKVGAVKTFLPQSGVSKAVASSLLLAGCSENSSSSSGEQQIKQQRSLFDRIVNPEMHPVIKISSEIIQAAVRDLFNISDDVSDKRRSVPFVEDGKRGTWKQACISGDLILTNKEDTSGYLHVKKNWKIDQRCPFNLVGHGDPFHVQIDTQEIHSGGLDLEKENILRVEGTAQLNAQELKQMIETAPGYKPGQPVNMYSCDCGVEKEGIAQELADEMQVTVSAFTGHVVNYYHPGTGNAFFTAGDVETGFKEIKTFYPRDPNEPRQRRISNIG